MRTHGTLLKWNDERGFGFIEPAAGTEVVFVHVSAFPRDGVRPRIGELLSFEIERRQEGKMRAVRIMRGGKSNMPSQRIPVRTTVRGRSGTSSSGLVALVLLMLGSIGWYGYASLAPDHAASVTPAAHRVRAVPKAPAQAFSCDGRTRCPQMTSCAEATYFLRQCPGTQMDGDGDGQPCESQWCGAAASE